MARVRRQSVVGTRRSLRSGREWAERRSPSRPRGVRQAPSAMLSTLGGSLGLRMVLFNPPARAMPGPSVPPGTPSPNPSLPPVSASLRPLRPLRPFRPLRQHREPAGICGLSRGRRMRLLHAHPRWTGGAVRRSLGVTRDPIADDSGLAVQSGSSLTASASGRMSDARAAWSRGRLINLPRFHYTDRGRRLPVCIR
jgi:hypothetical protein